MAAFAVALTVAFVAGTTGTTGFGHVTGLEIEGDPHHPPNSSTTAF